MEYDLNDEQDYDFIQRVMIEENVLKVYNGSLKMYNQMLSTYERMKHDEWIDRHGNKRYGVMGNDLKQNESTNQNTNQKNKSEGRDDNGEER